LLTVNAMVMCMLIVDKLTQTHTCISTGSVAYEVQSALETK